MVLSSTGAHDDVGEVNEPTQRSNYKQNYRYLQIPLSSVSREMLTALIIFSGPVAQPG